MPKPNKAPMTPFERLVKSHEVQLRRMEANLTDMRQRYEAESGALKRKIEARKEVLAKLKE